MVGRALQFRWNPPKYWDFKKNGATEIVAEYLLDPNIPRNIESFPSSFG